MNLLWIAPIEFGSTIHQSGEIGTAQALERSGWDVDFLSIKPSKEGEDFIKGLNFKNYSVRKSRVPGLGGITFNFAVARKIKKILKEKKNMMWFSQNGIPQ